MAANTLAFTQAGVRVNPVMVFPLEMEIMLGFSGDVDTLAPVGSETRTLLLNTLEIMLQTHLQLKLKVCASYWLLRSF